MSIHAILRSCVPGAIIAMHTPKNVGVVKVRNRAHFRFTKEDNDLPVDMILPDNTEPEDWKSRQIVATATRENVTGKRTSVVRSILVIHPFAHRDIKPNAQLKLSDEGVFDIVSL